MIVLTLSLIFILVIASTWWFGLWSNLITLVNLILSAMIASSFFENLAGFLLPKMASYAVLLPFLSLWLIFAISFFVLRAITDTLSSMRLRFDFLTETIGRSLLSVIIAWVFVCFTMFTLQLAPLPPNLFSAEESASSKQPETFGPDSLWASFIRSRSSGSFAETRAAGMFPEDTRELTVNNKPVELESRVFDPLNLFFEDAALMRRIVAKQKTLRKSVSSQSTND